MSSSTNFFNFFLLTKTSDFLIKIFFLKSFNSVFKHFKTGGIDELTCQ